MNFSGVPDSTRHSHRCFRLSTCKQCRLNFTRSHDIRRVRCRDPGRARDRPGRQPGIPGARIPSSPAIPSPVLERRQPEGTFYASRRRCGPILRVISGRTVFRERGFSAFLVGVPRRRRLAIQTRRFGDSSTSTQCIHLLTVYLRPVLLVVSGARYAHTGLERNCPGD